MGDSKLQNDINRLSRTAGKLGLKISKLEFQPIALEESGEESISITSRYREFYDLVPKPAVGEDSTLHFFDSIRNDEALLQQYNELMRITDKRRVNVWLAIQLRKDLGAASGQSVSIDHPLISSYTKFLFHEVQLHE